MTTTSGQVTLGLPPAVSLLMPKGKEVPVTALARVTSKGQVTVPKAVRDALGVQEGDSLLFRVEGDRAVLVRVPNFIDLAGSMKPPAGSSKVDWRDERRLAREALAKKYR